MYTKAIFNILLCGLQKTIVVSELESYVMDYLQTANIDLDAHIQTSELVTLSSPNKNSFSFLFEEWDNLDISYIDDQNIFSGDENSFQQNLSPQIHKRMDEVMVRRRKQTTTRKLIKLLCLL